MMIIYEFLKLPTRASDTYLCRSTSGAHIHVQRISLQFVGHLDGCSGHCMLIGMLHTIFADIAFVYVSRTYPPRCCTSSKFPFCNYYFFFVFWATTITASVYELSVQMSVVVTVREFEEHRVWFTQLSDAELFHRFLPALYSYFSLPDPGQIWYFS